jgi:four helix bundle protein
MASRNDTDLIAWQRGMDLVESAYEMAKEFPRDEMFGLTSQLRRAAVSIPSNIAEGQGRRTRGEFRRHLRIAHGSLLEVETHVRIAARLQYISVPREQDALAQCGEIGRLLNGLLNALGSEP